MGFLKRLFGGADRDAREPQAEPAAASPESAPAQAPSDMIRMFDREGQAVMITAQEYRTGVLPQTLAAASAEPDQLYGILVDAFGRGWFEDGLESARRLLEIDPIRERAANLLGIALMRTGQLDEAQSVLEAQVEIGGLTGVVQTNLAKIQADRGDAEGARRMLWEAIELDPNLPNSVDWWGALARDRDGEEGWERAMESVAALEGSWRAQLWLARAALERDEVERAVELYRGAIPRAREYGDALMMISGDLGRSGQLRQAVDLVGPVYDPNQHGPSAGFNLVHAWLQLGERAGGLEVVERLEALGRADLIAPLRDLRGQLERLGPG